MSLVIPLKRSLPAMMSLTTVGAIEDVALSGITAIAGGNQRVLINIPRAGGEAFSAITGGFAAIVLRDSRSLARA